MPWRQLTKLQNFIILLKKLLKGQKWVKRVTIKEKQFANIIAQSGNSHIKEEKGGRVFDEGGQRQSDCYSVKQARAETKSQFFSAEKKSSWCQMNISCEHRQIVKVKDWLR